MRAISIIGNLWRRSRERKRRWILADYEFEQLVQYSERLARGAGMDRPPTPFETLVSMAIDDLPAEFRALLEDVPVVISHRGVEHGAYGLYQGDGAAHDSYPDRIVIFEDTLTRDFGGDPAVLEAQIERTVRHELAHHLGWNERGVHDLGL